nr:hypothetical protein [Tanacetum cinerariifolium]
MYARTVANGHIINTLIRAQIRSRFDHGLFPLSYGLTDWRCCIHVSRCRLKRDRRQLGLSQLSILPVVSIAAF